MSEQPHCKCGQFASARRWVGFRELLTVEPECKGCAAKRRTTLALRREVAWRRVWG